MHVIEWLLGDWQWAELREILLAHPDAAVVQELRAGGLL